VAVTRVRLLKNWHIDYNESGAKTRFRGAGSGFE
jgi:hypothetical protein